MCTKARRAAYDMRNSQENVCRIVSSTKPLAPFPPIALFNALGLSICFVWLGMAPKNSKPSLFTNLCSTL